MYPLRFEPIFRRYIWGGQRLGTVLNKPIGSEKAAESWEIVDHQDDQSIVQFGPLKGKSLRQLVSENGIDLLNEKLFRQITSESIPAHLRSRFPLLFKFLDANRNLSVQVHPDDEMGATLSTPDLGKTEAWYVMHADPGSQIFAGLKQGTTREDFADAVQKGHSEELLHSFEPKKGDCVFVEAGTMHAIGEGLLVAEIQQASNTTFRVYDWGRVGDDGQPRELHIEQALKATDFNRGPVTAENPSAASKDGWQTLVDCEKFRMLRGKITEEDYFGGDGRFRILAVTEGELMLEGDPSGQPLVFGQTTLIPACLAPVKLTPLSENSEVLEILIP
ncbi:MAG: type I phosphomannose isomerase catalytic subunit [Planctomycetota bacterium]